MTDTKDIVVDAPQDFPDEPPRKDLPREPVQTPRPKTIILTVVAAVVFFALINSAASEYLGRYTPNRGYWIVHQKWSLLDNTDAVDTLLLGDSSCNQGIDPAEWTELTGERAVNLCSIGNMVTLDNVWMLERYIERHGPPKRVLVGQVYDMWHRSLNPQLLGQIPRRWGFWNDSKARPNMTFEEAVKVFASRYFPTYSQNASIKNAFRKLLSDPDSFFEQPFFMRDDGFMPWKKAYPRSVRRDGKGHLNFVRKKPFEMSVDSKRGLEALADLAEEHAIDVHVVRSPAYEVMARDARWKTYNKALSESLARWADASAHLHFHDELFTYSAQVMENADHLVTGAAIDYTRKIAKLITGAETPGDFRIKVSGDEEVLQTEALRFSADRPEASIIPSDVDARTYSPSAFTFDIPVRLERRPGDRSAVLSKWRTDTNERAFEVGVNSFQLPYLAVSSNGHWDRKTKVVFGNRSLRLGHDHLLTVTYQGSRAVALYLDGEEIGRETRGIPATIHLAQTELRVGNRAGDQPGFAFPGVVGTMEFSARPLASSTVARRARKFGAKPLEWPQLKRVTNKPGSHWFAYYDKQQFSDDMRYLLVARVDFENRSPEPSDKIKVGMVDLQNDNEWIELGVSRAWNWQQGCMLQWRPGHSGQVMWNDREDGQFVVRILDVRTRELRTLPKPIYHVAPDGKHAVGTDFARIQDTRPGYGYAGIPDPGRDDDAPEESSIYRIDLDSGEWENIITLSDIARIQGTRSSPIKGKHYFNHLQFNTAGDRFLFLHRWLPKSGRGFRTRMFTADADGTGVKLVLEDGGISHYTWRDESHILNWVHKYRGFVILNDPEGYKETVLKIEDGHQSYVPGTSKRWIVADTYPSRDDRTQTLYAYDIKADEIVVLARENAPRDYRGEWRVDFHPRVSHDGSTIAIDSAHEGLGRQQYLIDLSGTINDGASEL